MFLDVDRGDASQQAEFSKACTTLITNANAPELIRKVLEQRENILKMENTEGKPAKRFSI